MVHVDKNKKCLFCLTKSNAIERSLHISLHRSVELGRSASKQIILFVSGPMCRRAEHWGCVRTNRLEKSSSMHWSVCQTDICSLICDQFDLGINKLRDCVRTISLEEYP